MRRIRNLNRSTKLGVVLLLVALLGAGGLAVFDGGSGGKGVQVLGAVASVPLTPTITSGPSAPTSATTATFTYTGDNGVKFQCKRNGDWKGCESPKVINHPGAGSGTLQVRAKDRAKNVDPTPAKAKLKD